MKILGLNRVELLLEESEIDGAVERINEVFGFQLTPPHTVDGHPIRSSIDFGAGLELCSPVGADNRIADELKAKGRGALFTVVWEVDSIEAAKGWAAEKGVNVLLEFQNEQVHQLVLDPEQFYGFKLTLMERRG